METTTKRQALLKVIHEQLETVSEEILENILEMLEDEEDVRDALTELEDAKINGTISWEEYKRETV